MSPARIRQFRRREIFAAALIAVAAKLIKDMSKTVTTGVGKQLVWARENGEIPWAHIVDETRSIERAQCWDDQDAFFRAMFEDYAKDYWADQPKRLVVWSEKGTVRGTLAEVLDEFKVPFQVFHGFNSATLVWDTAGESRRSKKPLVPIYIGDFDPSGLYMSEVDLPERLRRYGAHIELPLLRPAITAADVRSGTLPDFPASDKRSDSRYRWFVENHGHRCVELDAMSPPILRERVRTLIQAHIDPGAWERSLEIEQEELAEIDAWKERILGDDE